MSSAIRVQLKWGKVKWEGSLDPSQSPSVFKEAIYQKTGVPVERQKVMAPKGWAGTLKDQWVWKKGSCQLKDGAKVNVVGTSTGIPEAPKTSKIVFMEDMSAEDKASAGAALPPGLVNLGNTCYMNSTVQALGGVKEFRDALVEAATGASGRGEFSLASLLGRVYERMQHTTEPLKMEIGMFWRLLQQMYPQYGERGPNGVHKQQDADEFFSNLLTALRTVPAPKALTASEDLTDESTGEPLDLATALFGITMETTMTCQEGVEEPTVKKEKGFKIICNIDGGGGAAQQINHLGQGLLLGLEGQVEKQSTTLGRNALYKRVSRIDRLPRYLCVQYMRFYWKETPDSRDHQGVRCKIMRRVKFTKILDVFPYCSDRLKAELKVQRDIDAAEIFAKNEAEDKARADVGGADKGATKKKSKAPATSSAGGSKASKKLHTGPSAKVMKMIRKAQGMKNTDQEAGGAADEVEEQAKKKSKPEPAPGGDTEMSEEDKALQEALRMSTAGLVDEAEQEAQAAKSQGNAPARTAAKGSDIGLGLPDNFRGNYELHAIVTHKGRAADGGHYMGWVRKENSPDGEDWICFDDDQVDPCGLHNILDLSGGGDLDMAYLCFYKYRD